MENSVTYFLSSELQEPEIKRDAYLTTGKWPSEQGDWLVIIRVRLNVDITIKKREAKPQMITLSNALRDHTCLILCGWRQACASGPLYLPTGGCPCFPSRGWLKGQYGDTVPWKVYVHTNIISIHGSNDESKDLTGCSAPWKIRVHTDKIYVVKYMMWS